jgi:NTE family protein
VRWPIPIVALAVAVAAPAPAAEPPCAAAAAAGRPCVGLVLSGGGALGAAHVGVLKVLEELRVPVDCIAGTSIGAIVGGLYAAGLPPTEIEQVMAATDWDEIFDDRPARRRLTFRRKVDDLTYLAPLEFGFVDGRLQLPRGLIAGQKLDFLLKSLTLRAVDVERFDDLPVPFRAVATDVQSGAMVVFDRGNLADALRASMSVPGVFAPIELDGRLLVDGGIVRNLPTDVARAMGADVLIAVDVGAGRSDPAKLDTLTGLSARVFSLFVRQNVEASAALADLVITPDVRDFTAADFPRGAEMVARGEAAARAAAAELASFAVTPAQYEAFLRRQRRSQLIGLPVGSVQVASPGRVDARVITRRVRTKPHATLDLETLRGDLERIYELGDFELVDFSVVPYEGGHALLIDAKAKPWGPNFVRFGVNLASDLEGESAFNLLTSFNMTRLNRLGAEWKTRLQLGEQLAIDTEFFQPLDFDGRWFVAPYLRHYHEDVEVFAGAQRLAEYRVQVLEAGADLGVQLGRYGEVRLGLVKGRGTGDLRVGESDLADLQIDRVGWLGRVTIDQLDNTSFPREGVLAYGEWLGPRTGFGSDDEYDRLTLEAFKPTTWGRHTLVAALNAYSSLGSELPYYDLFDLGGLFQLSGVAPRQIVGEKGGVGALVYYARVGRLRGTLGHGLYVGASAEAGNLWQHGERPDFGDLRLAGSVFVGADTVIGPVYLAYGRSELGSGGFYLYVGRTF